MSEQHKENKEELVGFTHQTSESLHDYVVAEVIDKLDLSIYKAVSSRNHIDLYTESGVERFIEAFTTKGQYETIEQFANSCLSNLMLSEKEQRVYDAFVKLGLSIIKTNDIDEKESLFKSNDIGSKVYELEKTQLQAFMFYLVIFTVRHILKVNHKAIDRGISLAKQG